MRLVHLSDLHLGYRQFQRQTPAGINQREADVAHVFREVIDQIIALSPDLICIAGDVFHNVRPSNPAIILAFSQFSRLVRELPDAIVILVEGNHDRPRSTETVCILRLFSPLGIHVVDGAPQRLPFPERQLSVLAVPYAPGRVLALDPDPAFRFNVLVRHGELEGVTPSYGDPERLALQLAPKELHAPRWTYVALGHHHVFRQIEPNAFFAGAMEYTSLNFWGELQEESAAKLPGKRFVEFDLERGRARFHKIAPARPVVELPPLTGRGMVAADLDAGMRRNIERVAGGIDDKIVRQIILDVPRHVVRELDYKALREYKRRALHFHLDARRPDLTRTHLSGAPGRRPSLPDIVRERLRSRSLPPDIDREQLIELGLRYLNDADVAESVALSAPAESE
jgi:DNA repair exonuclease SbcCD nuclease subunit